MFTLPRVFCVLACCAWCGSGPLALAQNQDLPQVAWKAGPGTCKIGELAEVKVEKGLQHIGAQDTRTLLEAFGNLTNGSELALIAPKDLKWFIVYEWDETGKVNDDEKLDPDALLRSLKEGNKASNEYRKEQGLPALELIGWEIPPRYDPKTNDLTWATRLRSEGEDGINYLVRRLGRRGVMACTLVCDPEDLQKNLPRFEKVMASYAFVSGHRYADWVPGDKVAEYGLAALVTGGAAALAVKTGLFKTLLLALAKGWKLVVAGVVVVGGVIAKIFTGRRQ